MIDGRDIGECNRECDARAHLIRHMTVSSALTTEDNDYLCYVHEQRLITESYRQRNKSLFFWKNSEIGQRKSNLKLTVL